MDCRRMSILQAVQQTLTDVFMPAVAKSSVLQNENETGNMECSKMKFMSSVTTFIDAMTGAQDSLNDVVKLSQCQQIDLEKLCTPAMYQNAASSSETLEIIEMQAKLWVKEIEQVCSIDLPNCLFRLMYAILCCTLDLHVCKQFVL